MRKRCIRGAPRDKRAGAPRPKHAASPELSTKLAPSLEGSKAAIPVNSFAPPPPPPPWFVVWGRPVCFGAPAATRSAVWGPARSKRVRCYLMILPLRSLPRFFWPVAAPRRVNQQPVRPRPQPALHRLRLPAGRPKSRSPMSASRFLAARSSPEAGRVSPAANPISNRDATRWSSAPFRLIASRIPTIRRGRRTSTCRAKRRRRLCAERGARLCTELEWERACKGRESEMFAGGAGWDPRCAASRTLAPRRSTCSAWAPLCANGPPAASISDGGRSTAACGRARRRGERARARASLRTARRHRPRDHEPGPRLPLLQGRAERRGGPGAEARADLSAREARCRRLSRLLAADPRTSGSPRT